MFLIYDIRFLRLILCKNIDGGIFKTFPVLVARKLITNEHIKMYIEHQKLNYKIPEGFPYDHAKFVVLNNKGVCWFYNTSECKNRSCTHNRCAYCDGDHPIARCEQFQQQVRKDKQSSGFKEAKETLESWNTGVCLQSVRFITMINFDGRIINEYMNSCVISKVQILL